MVDGGGSVTDDEVHVHAEHRPFFWIFAVIGCVLFHFSIGYARRYNTTAAFLLPPFICFCLVFDNVVMATTGLDHRRQSTQVMLAFHACVVPMILLVCYEIAYMVHKQKSVNFCGISFESGHRRADRGKQMLSTCLRFAIWLVCLGLLVLNLLAAYHWTGSDGNEINSIYELQGDSTTHAVFSVLPAFVLVTLSLYIGMQLWNYGTFYSYMVHATCFNPWIWMLVGSLSLLTGYLMPTPIYAVSSNAGELIMMATIVRMFREVHHDMQQGLQMSRFIDPIPTRSPQSMSLSTSRSHGVMVDSSINAAKYEASGSPGHLGVTNGFIEVLTPKESEVRLTEADQHAHSTAFLSVVVSHSRTNPLFHTPAPSNSAPH
ncbi:TPA: hypothetical protein N0F65_009286 [Lagenidium giganteum]|uniref:Transmembrane protein n=1 Tax=Lagenidium giganteum TaxID=4803 RepID=A0AAV2YPH2_9STRA|nr:TPA: hypothetical protein N0F65_009286 [Lagenidium giganteum]